MICSLLESQRMGSVSCTAGSLDGQEAVAVKRPFDCGEQVHSVCSGLLVLFYFCGREESVVESAGSLPEDSPSCVHCWQKDVHFGGSASVCR